MSAPRKSENFNNLVQPLLTDKYQISMCYAYWKNKKHEELAVFDLYFRKNPFKGEYTIFAGLDQTIKFIKNFQFLDEDIEYLKSEPDYITIEDEFWEYIKCLRGSSMTLSAMTEGSVCFPSSPLVRIEGPLGLLQLVETTLLNLINYASLVATNAARYKMAARGGQRMLEFGLRRAQGPDGGLSASLYSYIGGFDGTSNLLAGKKFGIPVSGTIGHSFIMSYHGTQEIKKHDIQTHQFLENLKTKYRANLTLQCLEISDDLRGKVLPGWGPIVDGEQSELNAFISFAWSFPNNFLALVDTYDVLKSGLINFSIVAIALLRFGYKPRGIRIDSGDLAFLSGQARKLFSSIAIAYNLEDFNHFDIIASNDINEDTIICLNQQPNAITGFGIGTHLVTCQNQPALGCVYKLVEASGRPCMKLSSTPDKVNIPCKKAVYRLFSKDNYAILDLVCIFDEPEPMVGQRILCRHPFLAEKRSYVTPTRIESLLVTWWDGEQVREMPDLTQTRNHCQKSLDYITQDIKRSLNPTPYKVAVSERLFDLLNNLKLELTPIGEFS